DQTGDQSRERADYLDSLTERDRRPASPCRFISPVGLMRAPPAKRSPRSGPAAGPDRHGAHPTNSAPVAMMTIPGGDGKGHSPRVPKDGTARGTDREAEDRGQMGLGTPTCSLSLLLMRSSPRGSWSVRPPALMCTSPG